MKVLGVKLLATHTRTENRAEHLQEPEQLFVPPFCFSIRERNQFLFIATFPLGNRGKGHVLNAESLHPLQFVLYPCMLSDHVTLPTITVNLSPQLKLFSINIQEMLSMTVKQHIILWIVIFKTYFTWLSIFDPLQEKNKK